MWTVLIADDDALVLELAEAVLRHSGFDVHVVRDGRGALRALRSVRPDVLLTDLRLPGMDGLEVVRAMRRSGNDTPVVLWSADAREDMAEVAKAGGADAYIRKPFDPMSLAEQLVAVTGGDRRVPNLDTEIHTEPFRLELIRRLNGLADGLHELPNGDSQSLCTLAHRIAGSAGAYGFAVAGELAAEVEHQLRSGGQADWHALATRCRRAAEHTASA